MQDEQFQRQWSANHSQFTSGIAKGVARLRRQNSRLVRQRSAIGNTYGNPATTDHPAQQAQAGETRGVASVAAGILAAATTSVVLFVSVAALALLGVETGTPAGGAPTTISLADAGAGHIVA